MNYRGIIKSSILLLAVLLVAGNVFAGSGARNISSTSAQCYLVGAARWAESDDADTPLSNPAGAAFMEDGLHIHVSAIFANNKWALSNIDTDKEYVSESMSFIPAIAQTYKKGKWAAFLTVSFPGGQGGGEFNTAYDLDYIAKKASAATGLDILAKNHEYEFAGGKMGTAIGIAYQVNDWLSISYAARKIDVISYVDASCDLVLAATGQKLTTFKLDQERNGTGYGHTFSVLLKPNDKLKIGLRYDPEVFVDQYTEIASDDSTGLEDNEESENNLPAAFFAAISYNFTPNLKIDLGYARYWQTGVNGPDEPNTQGWGAGFEIQSGLEYQATSKLEILAGINFARVSMPNDYYCFKNLSFGDSFTFTLGSMYTIIPDLDVVVGLGYSIWPWPQQTRYQDEKDAYVDLMGVYEREVKFSKLAYFGIEYKL